MSKTIFVVAGIISSGAKVSSFITFQGPAGLGTPDDIEAFEACQAGYRAAGVPWWDISRGVHGGPQESPNQPQSPPRNSRKPSRTIPREQDGSASCASFRRRPSR